MPFLPPFQRHIRGHAVLSLYPLPLCQRACMQVSACGSLCLQIITPFTIYFNARFIYQKWELWRLLTNFMYFGSLGELRH